MLKMSTMYMDYCTDSPDTTNLPHFSVILAEAGKKPFAKDKDGNNQVIASKGIFSGMGFYSLANLRVEKVNDQTKGSSFLSGNNPLEGAGGWVTNYELSMWNKLIPGGDDGKELALDTGFLGISFNDFLVRKITIRAVVSSDNYRQGMSVISAQHMLVQDMRVTKAEQMHACSGGTRMCGVACILTLLCLDGSSLGRQEKTRTWTSQATSRL